MLNRYYSFDIGYTPVPSLKIALTKAPLCYVKAPLYYVKRHCLKQYIPATPNFG